jgi:hypothetical protein
VFWGYKPCFNFFNKSQFFKSKNKNPKTPSDVKTNSEHFWLAYLVMKTKIKRVMGDQRIFGS